MNIPTGCYHWVAEKPAGILVGHFCNSKHITAIQQPNISKIYSITDLLSVDHALHRLISELHSLAYKAARLFRQPFLYCRVITLGGFSVISPENMNESKSNLAERNNVRKVTHR